MRRATVTAISAGILAASVAFGQDAPQERFPRDVIIEAIPGVIAKGFCRVLDFSNECHCTVNLGTKVVC